MKNVIALAVVAVSLAGCQQSISERFTAMCEYQKANDAESYASSEKACQNADFLEVAQKEMLVTAYEDLKKARAAVEASGGK